MSREEKRIGGKAPKSWAEKFTRLSDHCFAPRYVKFFVCSFPTEEEEDIDPFAEVENAIARWINKGRDADIGYEVLSMTPSITRDEVAVAVLYRKFQLY